MEICSQHYIFSMFWFLWNNSVRCVHGHAWIVTVTCLANFLTHTHPPTSANKGSEKWHTYLGWWLLGMPSSLTTHIIKSDATGPPMFLTANQWILFLLCDFVKKKLRKRMWCCFNGKQPLICVMLTFLSPIAMYMRRGNTGLHLPLCTYIFKIKLRACSFNIGGVMGPSLSRFWNF